MSIFKVLKMVVAPENLLPFILPFGLFMNIEQEEF